MNCTIIGQLSSLLNKEPILGTEEHMRCVSDISVDNYLPWFN